MLRKVFFVFLCLSFIFILNPKEVRYIFAQTPTVTPIPTSTIDQGKVQQLQDQIKQYESKISDLQGQQKTLSSQIQIMDTQVRLTQLRVDDTKERIANLQKDIVVTKGKIGNLEKDISANTQAMIGRVSAVYEVGTIQPWQVFLTSDNVSNFFTRLKYLRMVQISDKKNIYAAQQSKVNYANQKTILEDKQKEELALEKQLENYTAQLNQEKAAKQTLLDNTRGDEANYQRLLAQARAQLTAFRGYVQSQGGFSLISADPSWPSDYYSQRDNRWGTVNIAGFYSSPSNITSIGASGCLISSVAMALTHKGNTVTPLTIGTNDSYFFDANFQWKSLNELGFNTPLRTIDRSVVDNMLSQGKWVIVGLDSVALTSRQPFHFVVITSKNGDDYNLYDPWKGPNISFNSNYGGDYITEVIVY